MRLSCFLIVLIGLVACAPGREDFGGNVQTNRKMEIAPEERAKLIPNALFDAVYDNSPETIRSILKTSTELLHTKNAYGDTPFGFALAQAHHEAAAVLLEHLTPQDLFHKNAKGESYVYLASRSGLHAMITRLGDLHYQSLGFLDDFEFSDLDQPDELGRTALFVAANGQVIEALEAQYYRGLVELPFWGFALKEDHLHRTYLHAAALDGRSEVILWSAERICRPGSWETSDSWWKSYPGWLLNRLLRGFQTYIGDLESPVDLLFNRRDDEGKTALHLALENRRFAAVRALTHCEWLDYDLADNNGHLPLHSFLKSLNPLVRETDVETRETFTFLLRQDTRMRRVFRALGDRINHTDQTGDSALHLAARLADPFFYKELARFGDIHLLNANHQSPEQIYLQRQSGVTQNGR